MLVQAGVTTGLTRFHMLDTFIIFPAHSMMVTGSSEGSLLLHTALTTLPPLCPDSFQRRNLKTTSGSPHLGFLEMNSSVQNEAAASPDAVIAFIYFKKLVCVALSLLHESVIHLATAQLQSCMHAKKKKKKKLLAAC